MKNLKNLMKREVINDVLTGLMVAATFAAVAPGQAWADLSSAINTTNTSVLNPSMRVVDMVCYGLGAFLAVQGIAGAKKHADAPGQNMLGPAIGKILAGGAFLVAPLVIGLVSSTGSAALTGQGIAATNAVQFTP